jgi:hypothetical protein
MELKSFITFGPGLRSLQANNKLEDCAKKVKLTKEIGHNSLLMMNQPVSVVEIL